ncbi:40S ribosomal protein S23 [Tanacetum coccineum]
MTYSEYFQFHICQVQKVSSASYWQFFQIYHGYYGLSSLTAHALPLSTTADVLPFLTGAFSISAVVRVVSKNAFCSRSIVVRVVSTRAEHIGPSSRMRCGITGFGRKGHVVGDIFEVRFKVLKDSGLSLLDLFKEKKEKPRSISTSIHPFILPSMLLFLI